MSENNNNNNNNKIIIIKILQHRRQGSMLGTHTFLILVAVNETVRVCLSLPTTDYQVNVTETCDKNL